ncbi:MAG: 2TM domain-containing protein [Bacteroidetes bacterium]|nr:2TM domain-containing protein [Bacteroidota bacterium]MCL2303373.1 2TM domain-containing protein [Lentimicrobiaceae bacterium]
MRLTTIAAKDLILKTAKKRVSFKKHVTIYILINLLLWVLFIFLFKGREDNIFLHFILFVLITWTIILVGHYFYAMKWNKRMVDKEVQSLIKETMAQQEEKMAEDVVREN